MGDYININTKIYIIINKSHKWDDNIPEDIEFISFNYEDAYYELSKLSECCKLPDDKWCYEYELWEYKSNKNRFDSDFKKLLIHVDNITEE